MAKPFLFLRVVFVLIRLEQNPQNQGSTQDSVSTWRRTRCQIAGLGVEVVFLEKGLEDSRRVLEALPSVGLHSNSEAAKVGGILMKGQGPLNFLDQFSLNTVKFVSVVLDGVLGPPR